MNPRTRRSPARFLGPLALIVVLIAFFAIISGSGGGSASSPSGTSSNTSSSTTPSSTTKSSAGKKSAPAKHASKAGGPSTYTVQVGDTLGGIAGKTGVPLSKIQELNPNADPHALVAGQKIKLKG